MGRQSLDFCRDVLDDEIGINKVGVDQLGEELRAVVQLHGGKGELFEQLDQRRLVFGSDVVGALHFAGEDGAIESTDVALEHHIVADVFADKGRNEMAHGLSSPSISISQWFSFGSWLFRWLK